MSATGGLRSGPVDLHALRWVRLDLVNALTIAGLLAGTGLRLWIMLSPAGSLDADEAVWGLMAMHVLHGQLPTFYWGQTYGGTQETFLTAALFWVFGRSTAALKTTPMLFWAVATALLWRVGRRTLGEPRARLAATLFWFWPVFFVWKSTRAHGFYGAGLVFGLWAMLSALRLRERPRRVELMSFGLAVGLGWWATPESAILTLPAVAWLLWSRPTLVRHAPLALAAFGIGSLPWWLYNARHGWSSIANAHDYSSKFEHARNLVSSTLPTALGLRLPFTLEWFPEVVIAVGLYASAAVGFGLLLRRRPPGVGLLLTTALIFPVLYVASPYTWYTATPRYFTLVAPVIVLLTAYGARTGVRSAGILAVAAAFSFGGLAVMVHRNLAASRTEGVAVPTSFDPLLRALETRRVHHAWATYWIAYRLNFESDERIVAAEPGSIRLAVRDGRVEQVGGTAAEPVMNGRYAPYQIEVARSRDDAYVILAEGTLAPTWEPVLRRGGYRLVRAGAFDIWLPPAASARDGHSKPTASAASTRSRASRIHTTGPTLASSW